MRQQRAALLLVSLSLFASDTAQADDDSKFDPDFHFSFRSCRISGSSLTEPSSKNDGFIEMKTGPHHTACERVGKKRLSCITIFEEEGAKPVVYDMTVTTETSQLLVVESENAADYLVVRPDTGRVVSTTRMVAERYLATKLCHGIYMTGDEFKAFEAQEAKRKRK